MEILNEQMRLLNKLLEMPLPERARRLVVRAHNEITNIPMTRIIDAIPGANFTDKAKFLGISRQAIHQWLYGDCRPSWTIAGKISQVTKFTVEEIVGRSFEED